LIHSFIERLGIITRRGRGRCWRLVLVACGALLLTACQRGAGETMSVSTNDAVPQETSTASGIPDLSYLVDSHPAEVDNSTLPITPVEGLHLTGVAPQVDIEQYRLVVDGLVEKPLALTYESLLSYPYVTEVVLLICPGFFVDNAQWTGLPVSALLGEAGVKPGASGVIFHDLSSYSYTQILTLETVQEPGVFLAYKVNGEVLPVEHGYPLRLVVKGRHGSAWVKWVGRIEVR
jgi:DMSO/TMAO reductase YedYZ molybdopterin-dependent catalytic subunit